MKKRSLLFYIFVVTLLFGAIFYEFIESRLNFRFTDEILTIVLILYWIENGKKNKETFVFLAIFFFYLGHSLLFPHNVQNAIFMDFIIQIKPYLAFYTVYSLSPTFSYNEKKFIRKICKWGGIFLLPIAIANFGGGYWMYFFCGVPSRFASTCTILAITYLYFSDHRQKDIIISFFMLLVGIASMRSKFFGFFACYVFFFFLWDKLASKRFFSTRNLMIISIILAVGAFVSWDKINFYFIEGGINQSNEEAMYARPFLYMKAVEILKDFPLLGTGFGSYATYASSVYYSPIYYDYKMVYNYEIGKNLFISDAFYPSLVEFGLIGIILHLEFWRRRLKTIFSQIKNTPNLINFKISVLIIVFFLIEGTSDSTFTQNRGMYMLMLLALILRANQISTNNGLCKKNEIFNQHCSLPKR